MKVAYAKSEQIYIADLYIGGGDTLHFAQLSPQDARELRDALTAALHEMEPELGYRLRCDDPICAQIKQDGRYHYQQLQKELGAATPVVQAALAWRDWVEPNSSQRVRYIPEKSLRYAIDRYREGKDA